METAMSGISIIQRLFGGAPPSRRSELLKSLEENPPPCPLRIPTDEQLDEMTDLEVKARMEFVKLINTPSHRDQFWATLLRLLRYKIVGLPSGTRWLIEHQTTCLAAERIVTLRKRVAEMEAKLKSAGIDPDESASPPAQTLP